jgi:uncharacterized protein (TIGR02611 family)
MGAKRVAGWVWFPFGVTVRFILRNGRRIGVTIAGVFVVLVGLAMLVLPGPGIVVIIAGLAILATEYVWAERMLNLAKEKAERAKNRVLGRKPAQPDVEQVEEPPSLDG